ncbi:unnamed protein product [Medioppia subpectinata]|uniref:CCHC-type domain-containing protein n=1 Tax=Medioppia subpectinata TaxID=1979941 RepID=A0A7R9PTR3_9ACAR|nr:unnamed protein product [Medioppia subpectinata]CAG2100716.1 unnamed protein product [Medioppia subpectinata]
MAYNGPDLATSPVNGLKSAVFWNSSQSPPNESRPKSAATAPVATGLPIGCQCDQQFVNFCKMHAISHADCGHSRQVKCTLCAATTDHKSIQWHISSDKHKQRHNQLMEYVYLLSLPIQSPSLALKLTQVLDINRAKNALNSHDVQRRLEVVELINDLIRRNGLKDYSVRLYGSSINGFGLKEHSDINLDIVCNHRPEGSAGTGGEDSRSGVSVAIVLSKIADIIQKSDGLFYSVRTEYNLKVPKVRFKDKLNRLEIELSITVEKSVRASRLLQQYCQIDDRVVVLGIALREWARMYRFDDQENGLWPAFAFPLLAVHFLQRCSPPVLPCLHELLGNNSPNETNPSQTHSHFSVKHLSEDNDTTVEDDFNLSSLKWTTMNNKSVGQLWLEMLRYYAAEFDAETYVVSIRTTVPVFMRADKKWSTRMLAIEDPTRPSLNLSRSVGSMRLYNVFIEQLRHSFKYFATPFVNVLSNNYNSNVRSSPLFTERDFEILVNETHFYDKLDVSDLLTQINHICNDLDNETDHKTTQHKTSDFSDSDDERGGKDNFFMKANKILKTFGIRMQLSLELEGTLRLIPATQLTVSFQMNKTPFFQTPQKFCRLCHRYGHIQTKCPDNELPHLKPMADHLDVGYDELLNQVCFEIFDNKKMDRSEEQLQEFILSDLEQFIRLEIPNARLELFGSTKNGFGARFCDLDICLTFDNNSTGEGLEFATIIENVGQILRTHRNLQNIIPIVSAKVPIVKFGYNFDRNRCVECDISLYNILARYNTAWLKLYTLIDRRVQVLGFVVKHFAKTCDMCDASRGSLSSYAYTLMTIHYLQQKRIIPVLQEIGLDRREERIVDGWDTWFFNDLQTLRKYWTPAANDESVAQLFVGFLRYYSEVFNFEDNVVCCRQLAPLKRLEKMWTGCKIAIEDPFLLSHNLGAGVSPQMAVYIKTSFILGRNLIGVPPIKGLEPRYRYWVDYFFDRRLLTNGLPPTGRGCRKCGKIGHKQNKCPEGQQNRHQRHDVRPERQERYVRHETRERHDRPDKSRDKPKPINRRKYN